MAISEPLTTAVKIVQAITITEGAAGSADVEGDALDMDGFEHVCMMVTFGALVDGGTYYIKAQQSADLAFSSPLDITGTKMAVADNKDDTVFCIDILRPQYQYVRVHVDRATQNATCCAHYLCYAPHAKPVTQPSEVTVEVHKDEITGTA